MLLFFEIFVKFEMVDIKLKKKKKTHKHKKPSPPLSQPSTGLWFRWCRGETRCRELSLLPTCPIWGCRQLLCGVDLGGE